MANAQHAANAHPQPGSIRRITPEQLRAAWDSREARRDDMIEVFSEAVYSYRLADMWPLLGTHEAAIRDVLSPRMDPAVVTRLNDLAERAKGDAEIAAELDRELSHIQQAGWHLSEIARAMGKGRSRVAKYNPSGKTAPPRSDPYPAPRRVRFVSLPMVPGYIFEGGTARRSTIRNVGSAEKAELLDLNNGLLAERARARKAKKMPSEARALARVYRAEEELVVRALAIHEATGVPLSSLSTVLRDKNRFYLARIARRHGYAAKVPPSMEPSMPVRHSM